MTASERLKAIRTKSGVSIRRLAQALDLSPSSYQHYEDVYKKEFLPFDFAKQVADVLEKHGASRTEILGLAAPSYSDAELISELSTIMDDLDENARGQVLGFAQGLAAKAKSTEQN